MYIIYVIHEYHFTVFVRLRPVDLDVRSDIEILSRQAIVFTLKFLLCFQEFLNKYWIAWQFVEKFKEVKELSRQAEERSGPPETNGDANLNGAEVVQNNIAAKRPSTPSSSHVRACVCCARSRHAISYEETSLISDCEALMSSCCDHRVVTATAVCCSGATRARTCHVTVASSSSSTRTIGSRSRSHKGEFTALLAHSLTPCLCTRTCLLSWL